MYKNINIYGNYYLVPDLNPPERKHLLDRLEIDTDDIKKSNILHDHENKQWCISGKRIVNDFDFPEGYRKNVEIPVYTMSEVEDDRFKMSNGHYSAFFFTTENNMGKATEKIRELGLDYRANRKDFETKNPSSLFLAFNNTVYPCNNEKRTQNTMDAIGLDWDNFYNPPEPIDELISKQRKDFKALEERCLSYILYFSRTLPVCTQAARINPFNIKDIPLFYLTQRFVSGIIEMNPLNLGFIPVEKLNRNLCIQAINKNSAAFIGLHQELKTQDICERAFDNARKETDDPAYLRSIIGDIPNADIHTGLMQKFNKALTVSDILKAIPENILNRKIYLKAIGLQEYAIMDIPDRFKSEEMALKAFDADIYLLNNVPDRYKTKDLCVDAIIAASDDKAGYIVLSGIPYPDIILESLKGEYKDIAIRDIVKFISKDVMTEEIASEIIRRDASCLPEIPFHLKNEEICLMAIKGTKENIDPLYAIPYDAMTEKVCNEMVNKFPQALAYTLPENKKTPELCLMAVKQDESLQKDVPEAIRNDPKLNIYRFGMLVEEQILLNFIQVKDLYEGKKVEIDYTEPTNQIPRKVQVEYNTQRESLNYYDSVRDTKSMENKQQNTISDKGKGLKM